MQIALYEYTCGGGLYALDSTDAHFASLLPEGLAMLSALADDLARVAHVEVVIPWDVRCRPSLAASLQRDTVRLVEIASSEKEREVLTSAAAGAQWTIVIAPESGGALQSRCQWVCTAGGRLL